MKMLLKITPLVVLAIFLMQMPSSATHDPSHGEGELIDCTQQPDQCVPCDPFNPEAGLCDHTVTTTNAVTCLTAVLELDVAKCTTTVVPPPPTTGDICIEIPDDPLCVTTTTVPISTTLPTLPTTTTIVLPDICLELPSDPSCPQIIDVNQLPDPTPGDGTITLAAGTFRADQILTDNGIGAKIPAAATGVFVEGHFLNGAGEEFDIKHKADGTIVLTRVGDEAADNATARVLARSASSDSGSSSRSASDPSCSDDARATSGFKAKKALPWKIRKRSIPGSLARRAAMRAIKMGANNIENVMTRCSVATGGVSLDQVYKGKTANKANLDSSGNCLSPNGKNVVDFSSLPVAGRTCSWYAIEGGTDTLVESDIRFNRNQKWTLKPSGGCSRALDLAGTATHEWGHAFGLAHVSTAHKSLTMTELLPLCSQGPRTLGKGDIRGLQAIY